MPLVASWPIAPSLPEAGSFHTFTLAWPAAGVRVAPESPLPTATYSHDPDWALLSAWLWAVAHSKSWATATRKLGRWGSPDSS